ncbi:unnamed protein product [Microthlaspi erraticum]|uniref:Uncharacterized protein n=1 Tax=Microthlaspi erraticum TaxID=1685480 RepID=A0A6D2IP20_9BRAS|nr:unnamed protein product [Microthlaspi erraticum]
MNSISRARVIGALSGFFQRFPSLPCGESPNGHTSQGSIELKELRNSTGWSSRWSSWSSRWLPPSSFAYPVELRPCTKSFHAPHVPYAPECSKRPISKDQTCIYRAIGRDIVDPHYKECLYAGIGVSCVEGEVMPGQWELQVYLWRELVLVIEYVLLIKYDYKGDRAIGRDIVDPHYKECLYAGIGVSCVEGEVMPGQWELQVYLWRVLVLVIEYVLLDAFSR